MMDCYTELMIVVVTSNTTALHYAILIMNNWVILYEVLEYGLTDNEIQLTSKFYLSLNTFLWTKQLAATTYYRKTRRQAKRFSKMLVTRPPHYVAEN